jgi:hypothetical protein
MTARTSRTKDRGWRLRSTRLPLLAVAAVASLALGLFASQASASRQAVDYIGGSVTGSLGGEFVFPGGVAVNDSGAGGVPVGTIYVSDGANRPSQPGNNRIQRFQREDNGTPADRSDDTYRFISAWGAGVQTGGSDYETCTVAAQCLAGIKSGGNGALAGDGSLIEPGAISVDQETGDVYVVDSGYRGESNDDNYRINVYTATGEFLRSFGWDVVESGPDDNGGGYEICEAGVDVCKTGLSGSGVGQLGQNSVQELGAGALAVSPPDGDPATGTVFLADPPNRRVNTYNLDGTSPSSFGSSAVFSLRQPSDLAVDSRGIAYLSNGKCPTCTENAPKIERYDTKNADGSGVGFIAPISAAGGFSAMAVDPDTDGAGPGADVLYAVGGGGGGIQQYGPINAPGLLAPPAAADDVHGTNGAYSSPQTIAVEPSTGRLYVIAERSANPSVVGGGPGVFVLDEVGPAPTASLDSLSGETDHSVTAHATIDPNGPPATSYHFEYSSNGTTWTSTPSVRLGTQESPQAIAETIDPPGVGLLPSTNYHVRLVAARFLAVPIVTPELTFTTLPGAPLADTMGAAVRTTSSARLEGRVAPRGSATTYRFEYGTEGPCDANPCTATESHPAGSGSSFVLVSQQLEGLSPNTTYHYRVVADNGNPGSPVFGEDTTVTTRTSDAPLSHGHFPGPPGSDRAYEQVSLPDTGGNPVKGVETASDDGERVFYRVAGGTPISSSATTLTPLYASRTASGWVSQNIHPPRDQHISTNWISPAGRTDLSDQVAFNFSNVTSAAAIWRLRPGQAASKVFEPEHNGELEPPMLVSADSSRVLVLMKDEHDPAHPVATSAPNLYDVSSATPRLVGLLPGGSVPSCGVVPGNNPRFGFDLVASLRAKNWVSPDGSHVFFPSEGNSCGSEPQLYVRDLDTEETKLISGPPLSGLSCGAQFIKSNSEAAYFWSQSRLSAEDVAPARCTGSLDGDVYRYELGDGSLKCLTCVSGAAPADVDNGGTVSSYSVAVSQDGSRVYFDSVSRLVPGAPAQGLYRVDVGSGDLAYVGPWVKIGDDPVAGDAITPDGSAIAFTSAEPSLDALGGQQNGGTQQYYLYDDRDRSLTCVSCPQDGTLPAAADVPYSLVSPAESATAAGANKTALSADGDTFAFATPTPLVGADQNTPSADQPADGGGDIYEWREGRLLLVTDGLTNWPSQSSPFVSAMTPDARDLFFVAATQYTPDALDGYARLYDARIGGGIDFPADPPPCPLEVCQGTPKGAPEEPPPGTSDLRGPGNEPTPRPCSKGKVRRHGKCVPRHHRKRHHKGHNRAATRDRRAGR